MAMQIGEKGERLLMGQPHKIYLGKGSGDNTKFLMAVWRLWVHQRGETGSHGSAALLSLQ